MHLQMALTSEHGRFWLSSVQRAQRVSDEKRRQKKKKNPVKPKSTENYVGQPN